MGEKTYPRDVSCVELDLKAARHAVTPEWDKTAEISKNIFTYNENKKVSSHIRGVKAFMWKWYSGRDKQRLLSIFRKV